MYTDKEINDFGNKQPAMPVDGVGVLFDPEGRVLLVKPSYKKGWSLVGGYRQSDESPLDCARREVKEEINLDLPTERLGLFGVRYIPTRDGRKRYVQVYFRANLTLEEVRSIRIQGSELSEYRFVFPRDMHEYADSKRMQAASELLKDGGGYVEAERLVCFGALITPEVD